MRQEGGKMTRSRCRTATSLIGGLALWELIGRFAITDAIVFAPFSRVLAALWSVARTGEIWTHLCVSGIEFLVGFGLAAVVGVVAGTAIAMSCLVRDYVDPWVSLFYSSPLVALMPFYILVFGIGMGSKIAIIFTVAVFPILLNTATGIRATDQRYLEVAHSFNCTKFQIFRKILIPSAIPFTITGLRLGIGRGLTAVVVGELFSSRAGLGYLIASAGQSFDTPTVLMGVLLFSIAGISLMNLLNWLESYVSPWKRSL